MDGLVLVTLAIVVVIVGGALLAAYLHPGSGADVVDWKPTRSPELEAELELADVDEMLQAANRRRRRRGQEELTEDDISAPRLTPQGRESPDASGEDSTDPMGEGAKKGQGSKAEG